MNRQLAIARIILVVGLLIVIGFALDKRMNPNPQPQPVRCEEDMACWDCTTMGNLICGEVNIGTAIVTDTSTTIER